MTTASLFNAGPQRFGEASRSDLDRARAAVARLQSAPASIESLRAWDEATALIADASARTLGRATVCAIAKIGPR